MVAIDHARRRSIKKGARWAPFFFFTRLLL
jgi:hypothetical protein